jgi:curved DNA binding protein
LGTHIDGFPALVCHSAVIGATKECPATGVAANLLQAAHLGAEAVIRSAWEGKTSADARKPVLELCRDFGCAPIEGMMSHALAKDNLSGDKTIVFRPTEAQAKTLVEAAFAPGDVFCIDVAVSAGEGKTAPLAPEVRTTVYARNAVTYALKLKTSRAVFSEIQAKHGAMAFHLRTLEDPVKSRMAIAECVAHQLLQPYDVQAEKDEAALTARFMFTAAVMPAGPLRLTDHAFAQDLVKPDAAVKSADLKALLDAPVRPSKKDKKPKA